MCRLLVQLLDKFSSLQIPAGALLELLPRLQVPACILLLVNHLSNPQTRFYSISSSLREHKNAIHLTAAVVTVAAAVACWHQVGGCRCDTRMHYPVHRTEKASRPHGARIDGATRLVIRLGFRFERMRVSHSIQLCMRSAGFHLPDDKSKPVVRQSTACTGLASG